MLCKGRKKAITFFDHYSPVVSEAKNKAIKGEAKNQAAPSEAKSQATNGQGPKTLTHKQMLQRLQIAFAQVREGNNSEKLLNEIRQIAYSLYQSKEINTIKMVTM